MFSPITSVDSVSKFWILFIMFSFRILMFIMNTEQQDFAVWWVIFDIYSTTVTLITKDTVDYVSKQTTMTVSSFIFQVLHLRFWMESIIWITFFGFSLFLTYTRCCCDYRNWFNCLYAQIRFDLSWVWKVESDER